MYINQAEAFKRLLEEMARLTTNSVEEFHGLALLYRGKHTALDHIHYVCKTNMAIYHKVATTTPFKASDLHMFPLLEPWPSMEGLLPRFNGCGHASRFCGFHLEGTGRVGEETTTDIIRRASP